MLKWINRKLTRNHSKVPLLYVMFDLNKFNANGAEGSCEIKLHPSLKGDEYVISTTGQIIDHIRETYDMNELSE